jgi:hypothetical protein
MPGVSRGWRVAGGLFEVMQKGPTFPGLSGMAEGGLVMTWKDVNVGEEFLFFPDGQRLAISWSVNRRTLKHCADFTDRSWYLSRILTPLLKECIVIESVRCYDSV